MIELPENVVFTKPYESVKSGIFEVGQHGHYGLNGARGSPTSNKKANPNGMYGHRHTEEVEGNMFTIGMMCRMDMAYALKGLSTTSQGIGLVYPRSAQLIHIIDGKYEI